MNNSEMKHRALGNLASAIRRRNDEAVFKAVDVLDRRFAMTHGQIYAEAKKADPSLSLAEFDGMIADGEEDATAPA